MAEMIHGVNYASAGGGVIFSSGSELVCSSLLVPTILQCKKIIDSSVMLMNKQTGIKIINGPP